MQGKKFWGKTNISMSDFILNKIAPVDQDTRSLEGQQEKHSRSSFKNKPCMSRSTIFKNNKNKKYHDKKKILIKYCSLQTISACGAGGW